MPCSVRVRGSELSGGLASAFLHDPLQPAVVSCLAKAAAGCTVKQQLFFGQRQTIERQLQIQLGVGVHVHIKLATWLQQHFKLTGPQGSLPVADARHRKLQVTAHHQAMELPPVGPGASARCVTGILASGSRGA